MSTNTAVTYRCPWSLDESEVMDIVRKLSWHGLETMKAIDKNLYLVEVDEDVHELEAIKDILDNLNTILQGALIYKHLYPNDRAVKLEDYIK